MCLCSCSEQWPSADLALKVRGMQQTQPTTNACYKAAGGSAVFELEWMCAMVMMPPLCVAPPLLRIAPHIPLAPPLSCPSSPLCCSSNSICITGHTSFWGCLAPIVSGTESGTGAEALPSDFVRKPTHCKISDSRGAVRQWQLWTIAMHSRMHGMLVPPTLPALI